VAGDEHATEVPPVGELRKANDANFFGDPLIVGTPEDAIAMIEKAPDFTHLAFGMSLPGIDPKKIRASMKLFAEEVIPHFRRKARSAKKTREAATHHG